jgi:hypothetical protein
MQKRCCRVDVPAGWTRRCPGLNVESAGFVVGEVNTSPTLQRN